MVDLDFQTSHLCDYLDSEPRLQIDELSNAPERLDDQLSATPGSRICKPSESGKRTHAEMSTFAGEASHVN